MKINGKTRNSKSVKIMTKHFPHELMKFILNIKLIPSGFI